MPNHWHYLNNIKSQPTVFLASFFFYAICFKYQEVFQKYHRIKLESFKQKKHYSMLENKQLIPPKGATEQNE